MNLNWLYKAIITVIATVIVLLIIDTIGLVNPISETINEIDGIFYVCLNQGGGV